MRPSGVEEREPAAAAALRVKTLKSRENPLPLRSVRPNILAREDCFSHNPGKSAEKNPRDSRAQFICELSRNHYRQVVTNSVRIEPLQLNYAGLIGSDKKKDIS